MSQPTRFDPLALGLLAAWLALVALPPLAFLEWRARRLPELERSEVQVAWDEFRADMRRHSDRSGPVQRKVPRSLEPPERVWLRDHARLAVVAWVALVGVLGGCLALLVFGVARGRSPSPTAAPRAGTNRGGTGATGPG